MLYSGKSNEKKTIDFTDSMFIKIQSVDNEYMGISEVNVNAENVAYTFKGRLAQWDVINEPTQSNDLRTKYNSVKIQADMDRQYEFIGNAPNVLFKKLFWNI